MKKSLQWLEILRFRTNYTEWFIKFYKSFHHEILFPTNSAPGCMYARIYALYARRFLDVLEFRRKRVKANGSARSPKNCNLVAKTEKMSVNVIFRVLSCVNDVILPKSRNFNGCKTRMLFFMHFSHKKIPGIASGPLVHVQIIAPASGFVKSSSLVNIAYRLL